MCARFEELKAYWSNTSNPFNLPRQWKASHPDSSLYYLWFHRNVTNVHTLSPKYQKLVRAEIGKANRSRTVAHNKLVAAKSSHVNHGSNKSNKRRLCSYVASKGTLGCQHAPSTATPVCGRDKELRCSQHRFLTSEEMKTESVLKKVRNKYYGLVRLGNSKLPKELNAGIGVFANRHFVPDESITWYAGEKCSLEQVEAMRGTLAHDYVILPARNGVRQVAKPYWLGIVKPEVGKGLGSFVNAPFTGSLYQANCAFKFDSTIKCPVIYALRDIWPGDELYMAYGRGKRGSHVLVA